MHFSIPDTQEVKDEHNSSYIAYNVHINGTFHCSVRYRQLHYLHDQLRRAYGPNSLPLFPPKKLLPLTPAQTEERRTQLEKYIQLVIQDSRIANSELFTGFLLNSQQETQNANEENVMLDVYLMNWQKISVMVSSMDRTSTVMENVWMSIKLPEEYYWYFCIYLIHKHNNEIIVVRRLQDFEAPYLSLKAAGNNHYLVVRKSYWDPSYDDELVNSKVPLNLLYVQAVSDIEHGWAGADKDTLRQLVELQARGSKLEYLRLARSLRFYGHLQFKPCVCDYPQPNTNVIVSCGGRELVFRFQQASVQEKDISFRVTRIRCWRITTSIADKSSSAVPASHSSSKLKLELSFEYLLSQDKLQWICVVSDQAILMSVCLQGMVDELLMKQSGNKRTKPSEKMTRRGSWNYMKRDGSSYQISVSRSVSNDGIVNSAEKHEINIIGKSKDQVRKIAEKLSGVSVKYSGRNSGPTSPKALVENDAFEGIGDEDL